MAARLALGPGVLLLALALALGCAPRSATPDAQGADLLPSVQATTFGDSVQFVLQVTNTGDRPVELEFRSGQQFDFRVEREGREVWRWSADQMFTQALQRRSLPAGETLTYTASWRPAPSLQGEFTVRGTLTAAGRTVEQQARFRLP